MKRLGFESGLGYCDFSESLGEGRRELVLEKPALVDALEQSLGFGDCRERLISRSQSSSGPESSTVTATMTIAMALVPFPLIARNWLLTVMVRAISHLFAFLHFTHSNLRPFCPSEITVTVEVEVTEEHSLQMKFIVLVPLGRSLQLRFPLFVLMHPRKIRMSD